MTNSILRKPIPLDTAAISKIAGALVAFIIAWMGNPSEMVYGAASAAGLLLLLDYASAHRAARWAGELVTSKKLREMMGAKIWGYGQAMIIFVIVGIVLRTWVPITGIMGWIAYCEALSNLENLRKSAIAAGPEAGMFYRGVTRLADAWLGKLPGAEGMPTKQLEEKAPPKIESKTES